MPLESKYAELVTDVSRFAGTVGGGELVEGPRTNAEIMGLFDRCKSTFGAVRMLLHYDFVHEAVLLGRPLFTE
ncbi:MAG TPA: hypothetical protein VK506_05035 [Conexibacter sp.]|nr:hypothetical protein [Conexibacter sp.]